jgi:6-phosphogluconolactonase/glucosamine-6-phosphate isomerase/deaminase
LTAPPTGRPIRDAGEPLVEVFADAAGASSAAAERIAAALADAAVARGRADWVTTGGSTPVPIYRRLSAEPLQDRVPWDRVHVWWGDDRFVPRDHPLSNVLPFDQVLLEMTGPAGMSGWGADEALTESGVVRGAPLRPETIHAIPMGDAIAAGAGPDDAAGAYETELRAAGLPLAGPGFPVFDVILLGVGPDGHLLSVFPGSALFDSKAWVAGVPAPTHVEPHVDRVSLNPAVVEVARLPLVVIHGAAKADIVAAVLGPTRDPRRWPAQVARRSGAVWLLDRAAAAKLAA